MAKATSPTFEAAKKAAIRHLETTDFRAIVAAGGDESLTHSETLKNIVSMNKLGLITKDSQRGVSYRGHRERAYVVGAMKDHAARKFVSDVTHGSDVLCFTPLLWTVDPVGKKISSFKRFDEMFPSRFNALWVTHDGGKPVTHMSFVWPWFVWEFDLDELGIGREHQKNVVPVVCVDMRWNRAAHTHLHKVILKSLRSS